MNLKIGAATLAAAVLLGSPAFAAEFYAHPLNAGPPTDLPGEHLVPGLPETVTALNSVAQPLLQPILAPDVGGAPAAPAPALHRRHHGHHKVVAHLHHHAAHRAA